MRAPALVMSFGIILLVSIIAASTPAFAAIAAIQSTATITDGVDGFDELAAARGITTVTIGSSTYALVVSGAVAGDDALTIIDITDPSNPSETAALVDGSFGSNLIDGVTEVATVVIGSSTYALLASFTDSSLTIIDITDPSNPSETAAITDSSFGSNLLAGARAVTTAVINGNTYAIVAANTDDSVTVIDISTPSSPTETDTATDNAGGFDVLDGLFDITAVTIGSNTYALVTSFDESSLTIIDITDPSNISETAAITDNAGGFDSLGGTIGVDTVTIGSSTYALVTSFTESSVTVIDISTPSSPTETSVITDGGNLELSGTRFVTSVLVGDQTYALVTAGTDDGFQILNISNPANILFTFARSDGTGSFTELDDPRGITTVTIGSTIYALVSSFGDDGVQIVTLKTPVTGADTAEFIQSIDDANGIGGAFTFPSNVATNSTNHIFVADSSANVIRKFNSTGIFLSNLGTGTAGNGNDQFDSTHDVHINSTNHILVADANNNRIQIFNSAGTYQDTISDADGAGGSFNSPHALTTDSSGNIYVVDLGNDRVQVFYPDGTFLDTITGSAEGGTAFNQPVGIAIDSNNRIIISDNDASGETDNFQIFTDRTTFLKKITTASPTGDTVFDDPHTLAVDSSDRIYVGDGNNNRIQIFDSSGTFLQSITTAAPSGDTAFDFTAGLDIDSNGRIITADASNFRIQIFEGFGVQIAATEGSSETIVVDNAGGTATVQFSETENTTTETVTLAITLPSTTSGTVVVETIEENTVESGVELATATDITAPCTDTCTVSFTVPNTVLTALGLTSTTAKIYHDSDGDEILEVGEDIATTIDTTTTAGSTIFTGSASFTSKFAVGGVVGTTSAQATAGAAASFGLFGLINTCEEDGFGDGKSLMVYDITYDKCDEQQIKVYADTTCGPMTVKIGDPFGISIAGMPSDQPLLNNDTKKVIYTHLIEPDMEWFNVIITDKKDEFTDKIYTNQCTGTISFTGNTEYTSEQQGTSSPSEESEQDTTIKESETTETVTVIPGTEVKIIQISNDDIDPEPTETVLEIDPEPIVIVIDPEPEDIPLWLQSFTKWWELFIK